MFCTCGKDIPLKRIEFLKKYKKRIICIECSTEEKVVGNQVIHSKDTREIEILTKTQAENITKTSKQGGVSLRKR